MTITLPDGSSITSQHILDITTADTGDKTEILARVRKAPWGTEEVALTDAIPGDMARFILGQLQVAVSGDRDVSMTELIDSGLLWMRQQRQVGMRLSKVQG